MITPYPGTEIWHSESKKLTTRDYRLFDIQRAVLPTKLPLERFYEELVHTQAVINRKFLGWRTAIQTLGIISLQLAHGQTNFVRMLWKFNQVYNPERQYADHFRQVHFELPLPEQRHMDRREREQLYVHRRPSAVRGGSQGAATAS